MATACAVHRADCDGSSPAFHAVSPPAAASSSSATRRSRSPSSLLGGP
ncbi:hypothetical protein ACGFKX_26915 [Pseudonocardia alni]